jgi:hypothetical protein
LLKNRKKSLGEENNLNENCDHVGKRDGRKDVLQLRKLKVDSLIYFEDKT